jgi:hypothetical protein
LFKNQPKLRRNTNLNFSEISAVVEHKAAASDTEFGNIVAEKYIGCFRRPYDGVALDYDGTIVPLTDRTGRPAPEIINLLECLLDRTVTVVIISGRGHSVLSLQSQLSERNRGRIVIALYNGAELMIGEKRIVHGSLSRKLMAARHMVMNVLGKTVASIEIKRYCMQVMPRVKSQTSLDSLTTAIQQLLPTGLVARNSGFAVDVFPVSQLKNACLNTVNVLARRKIHFLRVGDQGHELGNDYELLNVIGGFSVGTLSHSPKGCFPVIDRDGRRKMGVHGTLYLLGNTFDLD